jgi:hypothetical protein
VYSAISSECRRELTKLESSLDSPPSHQAWEAAKELLRERWTWWVVFSPLILAGSLLFLVNQIQTNTQQTEMIRDDLKRLEVVATKAFNHTNQLTDEIARLRAIIAAEKHP